MKQLLSTMALTLALALVAIPALASDGMTVKGVDVPGTLSVNGEELVLNGAGNRSRWFMNLYVGSLYLPENSSDADAIIAADEPMAITLHITSGMINSDRMTSATEEGFENATGGNTAPIREYIDQFMGVFEEEIEEGDIFNIAYVPDNGVKVYRNGEQTGEIDGGMAFKQALFGIWLSDSPAQGSLKEAMLGN